MRSSLFLALVVASACGGATDATVSGVFPAEGFTGRALRVEISGDATEWSGTPAVSFGEDVTVSGVTVASPTSLFVDLTLGADAALGLRDVTVMNGGTFTLEQAFDVRAPLGVSFDGQVAQGGAPYFTISNHDFETPFDLTQDAQGVYTNLAITPPFGVRFAITSATAYQLKGITLIDANAAPGPFSVSSGLPGKEIPFNLGEELAITPRNPVPLADGATGSLGAVGDSAFYTIDVAQAPALVRIVATTSTMNGDPRAFLLPGGKWDQGHPARRTIETTAGTYDVVVFDNATAAAYNYTIKSRVELLASAAEASDAGPGNATTATATVAPQLPFAQTTGTLASATDSDWIKITLTSSAVVHVLAKAPSDFTDTKVDILNSTGTASVIGGPVDDGDCGFFSACGEDFATPSALAAGTYFVEISPGATPFSSTNNMYTALVYIE